MIAVLLMTTVGSLAASFLPDSAMGSTSQIAMLFIGLRFLLKPVMTTREQMNTGTARQRMIRSVFGGLIVGFICGFVGAGGGMMMLFVLTSILGYQLHMAVGTSVFIMTFTALTGCLSHIAIGGMTEWLCLGLCAVFTLIWARIAAKIANRSKTETLNRVVGGVLVATSIAILLVNLMK